MYTPILESEKGLSTVEAYDQRPVPEAPLFLLGFDLVLTLLAQSNIKKCRGDNGGTQRWKLQTVRATAPQRMSRREQESQL